MLVNQGDHIHVCQIVMNDSSACYMHCGHMHDEYGNCILNIDVICIVLIWIDLCIWLWL